MQKSLCDGATVCHPGYEASVVILGLLLYHVECYLIVFSLLKLGCKGRDLSLVLGQVFYGC